MPTELKSPKKGLIDIKNNAQKCFLRDHFKHVNPVKIYPKRTTQADTKLVNDLNYDGVRFSVREKDFIKIETKNNICIIVFCYENTLVFQSTFQIKVLKT